MMITNNFIKSGKVNMVIDGQFGSSGKGLICNRIALDNHIDICCARLSPNAGHTFYYQNKKYITKHIPVSSIINDKASIYIGFGSVIDIDILFEEIEKFNIDIDRLYIHPRTAIITKEDKQKEKENLTKISSTLSGSGQARANKILRQSKLAKDVMSLNGLIKDIDLHYYLDKGANVFVETGQGYELSLNVGYSYPHCTSIDITPSAVLADFNVHPHYMGNCMLTLRLYPIRVGNVIENDKMIGYSGDIPNDSEEIQWHDLGVNPEITTVTGKQRRIFTFSKERYINVLNYVQPSHVFLNFINYIRESDLLLFDEIRKPDFVGYGEYSSDIRLYDDDILENYLYKRK